MNISALQVQVVDLGRGFLWGGRRDTTVHAVHLRIDTDEGVHGDAMAGCGALPARGVAALLEASSPLLVGADGLARRQVRERLRPGLRVGLPLAVAGLVDVALWDIAGKAAGLPLVDLLGRRRERLPSCASAPPVASVDEARAMTGELLEAGFCAIKLHACADLEVDMAVCRAVRESAGDGVPLMMDAMGLYGRDAALRLGRVLDDCGYRWYEDPLDDQDLDGWVALCAALDTPVAGVDAVRMRVEDYARPVAMGAFDIVRMDAARHGITELTELAALARAFGIGCEPHAFGVALAQAANLHCALATDSGSFFELPAPLGGLDAGVQNGIGLDADGHVQAPAAPGLGLALDDEQLRALRIA